MRNYFPMLYGNVKAKVRLGNAILGGKLPHAFLLTGSSGSGKKTLARQLAMAVNCEKNDSESHPLPCGTCNTCRRICENNFTDITYIRRLDDKATIGVEEVRNYRADMFLSPGESDHKIYIFEEADKMTEPAQNALLKVLEEPPQNVIIILLCETQDKMLTTIKSRVQTIGMERFEFKDLKNAVLSLSQNAKNLARTNPEATDGIIMSADGRIGRALSLFSETEAKKNEEDRLAVQRIVNAMRHNAPYKELYLAVSALPKARVNFIFTLETLMTAIRDILLAKFDKDIPLLFYTSREEAQAAAKEMNSKRLLSVYEAVKAALDDAGKNAGVSAITADLTAKIKLL